LAHTPVVDGTVLLRRDLYRGRPGGSGAVSTAAVSFDGLCIGRKSVSPIVSDDAKPAFYRMTGAHVDRHPIRQNGRINER
jgi:hypothetical protein